MIAITKDYTEYKFIGDTNDEEMYHIIFPVFHNISGFSCTVLYPDRIVAFL